MPLKVNVSSHWLHSMQTWEVPQRLQTAVGAASPGRTAKKMKNKSITQMVHGGRICAARREWNKNWRESNDCLKASDCSAWIRTESSINADLSVFFLLMTGLFFSFSCIWPCTRILLLLTLWTSSGICPAVFIATWSSGKPVRRLLCVDSALFLRKHFCASKTYNLRKCKCSFYQSPLDSCGCHESHFINFKSIFFFFFRCKPSLDLQGRGQNAAD